MGVEGVWKYGGGMKRGKRVVDWEMEKGEKYWLNMGRRGM